ncbi:MAG: hypothetical protein FJ403_05085 [Verrucomicrobia bacterium]|nr:hypothetical protein [Verrucomicrobiota bacterium]
MTTIITSRNWGRAHSLWFLTRPFLLLWLCLAAFRAPTAKAELQFDVFLGYDGVVRESAWFPVTCEILNDGPSFNGVVEISVGNLRSDQVRRIPLELPTNTRKRFVVPMFASGGRFFQWNARLVDERGKERAERPSLQPRSLPWEGILLGALPRTFSGMPALPDMRQARTELKPLAARLQVEQIPDNPIAFEGLDALYLNSEKALGLSVNQAEALLAWVRGGGHLIVTVEQLVDVNTTPWLQQLLPCSLTDMVNITIDDEIQQWVRAGQTQTQSSSRSGAMSSGRRRPLGFGENPYQNLVVDPAFVQAQLPIAIGRVRDGRVMLSVKDRPLIVEADRGRGRVTLLTFNPEREPFHSWKNRAWFWSKLMDVPAEWYYSNEMPSYGGWSTDGVFGALIDSRQVRKLPVQWLLLLLVVYLIVIGPFDQYWLKRIGRQMLTWVTFPTYVVLFSLLIYFIGYKLRAGETEWNELQIVDVLPRDESEADLRGRTYASIYSSSNAKYQLAFAPGSADAADHTFATLRGELLDLYGAGREGSRATIEQSGNTFRAEVFVPVWTSLLYVNDWHQRGATPLAATVSKQGTSWQVSVENLLDRPLSDARLVVQGWVYELGTVPAKQKKAFTLEAGKGMLLQTFVQQHGGQFQQKVERRRNPLGDATQGQLGNPSLTAAVVSFSSHLPMHQHERGFVSPPGFDLTSLVERGDAMILAWDANHALANPITQFKPPRSQRNTLLRLAVPAGG